MTLEVAGHFVTMAKSICVSLTLFPVSSKELIRSTILMVRDNPLSRVLISAGAWTISEALGSWTISEALGSWTIGEALNCLGHMTTGSTENGSSSSSRQRNLFFSFGNK